MWCTMYIPLRLCLYNQQRCCLCQRIVLAAAQYYLCDTDSSNMHYIFGNGAICIHQTCNIYNSAIHPPHMRNTVNTGVIRSVLLQRILITGAICTQYRCNIYIIRRAVNVFSGTLQYVFIRRATCNQSQCNIYPSEVRYVFSTSASPACNIYSSCIHAGNMYSSGRQYIFMMRPICIHQASNTYSSGGQYIFIRRAVYIHQPGNIYSSGGQYIFIRQYIFMMRPTMYASGEHYIFIRQYIFISRAIYIHQAGNIYSSGNDIYP
jgi:hypothetical protein